jgi:hypothetical protein
MVTNCRTGEPVRANELPAIGVSAVGRRSVLLPLSRQITRLDGVLDEPVNTVVKISRLFRY